MHGIYLSANNDAEGFRLPINPSEVSVSVSGDGEEYSISSLGKVNIPSDVELDRFELESYFPNRNDDPYLLTPFQEPQVYIDEIRRWMNLKKPIRYVYVNGSFSINELVTIEDFEYKESDGSGDVYFNLSLKKYVAFGPKKMTVSKASTSSQTVVAKKTPPRQNTNPTPPTYTLVKGDSLWKVAQKYTGNGANYPALAKLNNIQPSQYRKLPIGLKLKLPPTWAKK